MEELIGVKGLIRETERIGDALDAVERIPLVLVNENSEEPQNEDEANSLLADPPFEMKI